METVAVPLQRRSDVRTFSRRFVKNEGILHLGGFIS